MPIQYVIDHKRWLVVARGHGTFTDADMYAYQDEVWTRPDVVGYDELVDMSDVQEIAARLPTAPRMHQLAQVSATMDSQANPTKFAIVAPDQLVHGLGRIYQSYRANAPGSTKQVAVFKTLLEALAFLGIESLDETG